MLSARVAAFVFVCLLAGGPPLAAQEPPLAAGSDGVPVPRKTKDKKPIYPPEAVARGIRGIVILDLLIDEHGRVGAVTVVRSVPGLDEAAVTAARQWQYEPVKLRNRLVSVRLTVPITFALALPPLERAAGVPELRQGAMPTFPTGGGAKGTAAAEVTLEPDGRVGAARLSEGSEPWASALLEAIKDWRFAPPPEDAVLSFRVEAEFTGKRGSLLPAIILRATGLRRADLLGSPAPEPVPASQAPASPPPSQAPAPSEARSTPAEGAPAPAVTAPAPPAVEVITAPPPPLPPENGVSAIRDVNLDPGVPDLARGRRPVPPPLARMAGATGKVQVDFSVSAAGTTAVSTVSGPDLLQKAARQAVASWVFRRTRADRAYLLAVFEYAVDKATAVVRPQPAPGSAASPDGPPAPLSAGPAKPE